MSTEKELDAALDRILKASGSALRNYTMDYTLNQMRAAMREVLADCRSFSVAEPEDLKQCPFCGGKATISGTSWPRVFCKKMPD